jgi:short-subunit dehydrogenase
MAGAERPRRPLRARGRRARGIGLETARDEGVKVLVCARREDALAECRAGIEKTTGVTSKRFLSMLLIWSSTVRRNRNHGDDAPFLSSCTGPAKSAEIRFSKILVNEFGPHNIRVKCVVPGFVNTPERFAKWEQELAKRNVSPQEAEAERRRWSENNSMRNTRWGTPQELANVFVLSERASFVDGAVLVADNAIKKS